MRFPFRLTSARIRERGGKPGENAEEHRRGDRSLNRSALGAPDETVDRSRKSAAPSPPYHLHDRAGERGREGAGLAPRLELGFRAREQRGVDRGVDPVDFLVRGVLPEQPGLGRPMVQVRVAVIDAVARDPAWPALHQRGRRIGRLDPPIAKRIALDHLHDGEADPFDKSRIGRALALPIERGRHAGGKPGRPDEKLGLLGRRHSGGQKRIGDDQKTLLAPATSLVADTYFNPGEMINAGQAVVSLLPPGNIKVRFFAPQEALAKFPIGTAVRIHCDGCAGDIPATVRFVSALGPKAWVELSYKGRLVEAEITRENVAELEIARGKRCRLQLRLPQIFLKGDL